MNTHGKFIIILMLLVLQFKPSQANCFFESPDAILLIHGLAGTSSTWNELTTAMGNSQFQNIKNYKVCREFTHKKATASNLDQLASNDKILVFTLDFSDNQNLSFNEQGEEVSMVIEQIRKDFPISKVLLIGHSMGGLAARAYINNQGSAGISGLITITTPHLGSYLGYLQDVNLYCHKKQPTLEIIREFVSSPFFIDPCSSSEVVNRIALRIQNLDLSCKAVDYLNPDSDEIQELNSHSFPENLPVINIVSRWETDNIFEGTFINSMLTNLSEFIQARDTPQSNKTPYLSNALNAASNDGIVSVSSQYMNLAVLNGNEISFDAYSVDCFHADSPKETKTIFEAINSVLHCGIPTRQTKSIVFILDSSGSMKESDPKNIRLNSLASLVERMNVFDNILIVDFDNDAKWINQDNFHTPDINKLRNQILKIDADGGTNIGKALRFTSKILQQTGIHENISVVLLTDGMGDYSNEADWYMKNNCPIYTISIMDNINEKLLSDIAQKTKGIYFKARNEFDIIDAYFNITSLLNSHTMICKERTVGNGLISESFIVDPSITKVNISLFANKLIDKVQLYKPSSQVPLPGNLNWVSYDNYRGLTLNDPEVGVWTIKYLTTPKSESQLMVSAESEQLIDCEVDANSSANIKIRPYLINSIENSAIKIRTIEVQTPSSKTLTLEFLTDNIIKYFPSEGSGTYKFEIRLNGFSNGHAFQRFLTYSILTGSVKMQNELIITEIVGNFAEVEIPNRVVAIGDECLFYCITPTSERLVAKGIITNVGKNKSSIEMTESYSHGCRDGKFSIVINNNSKIR